MRSPWIFLAAACALACMLDRPLPDRDVRGAREREAGPYPSDWFALQRAYPFDRIPQAAWRAAVARAHQDRLRLARAADDLRAGRRSVLPEALLQSASLTWQPAGPYNIGGRVTAIAAVPGGATVYLGSANGGVWKSVNSGANWTPVFEEPFSIGALALQPGNPSVIYAGTGEANASVDSYDGAGLYRSTDAGQSWGYIGLAATCRIARVAVDPQNPNRVFVAAMGTQFSTGPDRGLYRSEDGGLNWTKVLFVSDSTGATDVAINPAHPETVYCATWERVRRPTYRRAYGPECGIWRSADHGTTWTRLAGGLPAPSDNVGRIALGIAPSRPSTIYAQIGSGVTGTSSGPYSGLGFYRSQNAGQSWTRMDADGNFEGNFGGFVWYFGDMAVDPTNPDVVYSLGLNLLRSANAGATWSFVATGTHTDHHALWIDPTGTARMALGNDGGFFWSTNGGTGWSKSVDLPITQFYAGTIDPGNPARLLGGSQDNQTMQTGGSVSGWSFLGIGGDGFYVVVDPTNSNVVLAEWQFSCENTGPRRSTNGGGSFGIAPSGFAAFDRYNWCTPVVMDPTNHNVVLVGSNRVYKSIDNGVSYAALSPDLTYGAGPTDSLTFHTITTLDASPKHSGFYYAGTDDGRVWRSLDGGVIWTNISAGLPIRSVTRVIADPASDSTVYVTLSGFGQDEHLAHVFRSMHAGVGWTPISGNLPDAPANDLVVDPADPSTLYLATDVGVYMSRDLGSSWFSLGQGLPVEPVFDLTLHAASRTLVAATHGRSQWKLDVSSLPVAVAVSLPVRLGLAPPVPNPSRGAVSIALELPAPARADVAVFDVAGRRVRTIYSGFAGAGRMSLSWDGFDERRSIAPAGVYFVRAIAGGVVRTQRMVRER